MGSPYFDMEFSTRFLYSEIKLSAYFQRYFRGLEMGFPALKCLFYISNIDVEIDGEIIF